MIDLRDLGVNMAKETGKILLENFRKEDMNLSWKGEHDVVTEVDHASEKYIIEQIRDSKMKCKILSEETGIIDLNGEEYQWIIDPLDGTYNYMRGIPHFCVSIGLEKDGEMILGIIYDPYKKDLFVGEKKLGSTLNGKKIQVSDAKNLKNNAILLEWSIEGSDLDTMLIMMERIFMDIKKQQVLRCLALGLGYLACGRIDGLIYSYKDLKRWDVDPGSLIVEEAGGILTDLDKRPWRNRERGLVAGNREFYDSLIDMVNPK